MYKNQRTYLMFLLTTIFPSCTLCAPTCVVSSIICVEALIYGVLCGVFVSLFPVTCFKGVYSFSCYTYTGCLRGMVNTLGRHSFGHSKRKNVSMYVCPIPNGFPDRAIALYSFKIVDKKEMFLIPVFIVQVTKLVQFT
jgi:hypothetical protein